MARPKHYSPEIRRFLVSVLYHEASRRGIPMTVLTNQVLQDGLIGSDGWKKAEEAMRMQEKSYQTPQPHNHLLKMPSTLPAREFNSEATR
jgi:hypothetical protein